MAQAHSDIIIYHYFFFSSVQIDIQTKQTINAGATLCLFVEEGSFVRLQTSHLAKALSEVFTCGYSNISCGLTKWSFIK